MAETTVSTPSYRWRIRCTPNCAARVGIAPETTLPLNGVSDFGWHPSLTGLQQLYDQGKVAVLPAVDYAKPDLSHFNSAAYWRTGIAGPSRVTTGWLGRALDAIGGTTNPLQGINVDWSFDPLLKSRRAPTATVFDPGGFQFGVQGVWDDTKLNGAHRRAAAGATRSRALKAVRKNYRSAFTIQDKLAPLRVDEDTLPPPPVAYPDSNTGKGFRNLARMLGAGFGTRVATLSAEGGYDTHDNQPGEHARLLQDLGDSLWAWQADLEARGLADRVLTLVWTEFGRRPQDNEVGRDRPRRGRPAACGGQPRQTAGFAANSLGSRAWTATTTCW